MPLILQIRELRTSSERASEAHERASATLKTHHALEVKHEFMLGLRKRNEHVRIHHSLSVLHWQVGELTEAHAHQLQQLRDEFHASAESAAHATTEREAGAEAAHQRQVSAVQEAAHAAVEEAGMWIYCQALVSSQWTSNASHRNQG